MIFSIFFFIKCFFDPENAIRTYCGLIPLDIKSEIDDKTRNQLAAQERYLMNLRCDLSRALIEVDKRL